MLPALQTHRPQSSRAKSRIRLGAQCRDRGRRSLSGGSPDDSSSSTDRFDTPLSAAPTASVCRLAADPATLGLHRYQGTARMDDKRVAGLVAGIGFVIAGTITATFPAGGVLAFAAIVIGLLLVVTSGATLWRARGLRRPKDRGDRGSSAGPRRLKALPAVSLREWSADSPWGTTPWGLAARIAATSITTLVFVAVASNPVDVTAGVASAIEFALGVVLAAAFFVPPWAIERWTKPVVLLPRRLDTLLMVPAAGLTLIAAMMLSAGHATLGILIGAVQLTYAAIAGVVLQRRERSSAANRAQG